MENRNIVRQFVRFKNYEEIKNTLHLNDSAMQDLVDQKSKRQIIAMCKAAGLTMFDEKLDNALRAGGVKINKSVGRKPLNNKEKIEKAKRKIKALDDLIKKLKENEK